mgnify:CR=1 FL=1
MKLLRRNKAFLVGAIILGFWLVIAAIGTGVWFVYSSARAAAAQKLLADATDIAGFEAVVNQYPGSMPAADALMRLAAAQREAGDL